MMPTNPKPIRETARAISFIGCSVALLSVNAVSIRNGEGVIHVHFFLHLSLSFFRCSNLAKVFQDCW